MPRFEYHAPESLDEVLALLAEHGDEAKVLAGGQSLVPLLAMRLARPTQVIDINRVESLSTVAERGDRIAFGATVRERAAERSSTVRTQLPLLAEALPFIGHAAIRTRGTIGGTVAHADASAEIPCVVAALDGEVLVRSASGERTIAAPDFFQGHFTTALADDECVVEVRLPVADPSAGYAFQEIARRHGDFALVGVATMISLGDDGLITDARISLMGVADVPLRARAAEAALVGAQPIEDAFVAAAQTATADLRPASDVHGSAEYRTHLTGVIVRRALTTAGARARGEQA
jgi:aerobic carbon-monoxide dehydrogenase medium subunit